MTPAGMKSTRPSSLSSRSANTRGVVRVPRQVFRRFLDGAVTPVRCVEAYHLHRTRLEQVAEAKLRARALSDDGNVEITGRDLRDSESSLGQDPACRFFKF